MSAKRKVNVAVLGAGSWGSTLALHLARCGHDVRLWEFDPQRAQKVATSRLSLPFLPDYPLPSTIVVTADLSAALADADAMLVVVPSHVLRDVGQAVRPVIANLGCHAPALRISATKGLEEGTGLTPLQVLHESAGFSRDSLVVLAGPNLSAEIAAGLPAAALAACEDASAAQATQSIFASDALRVYTSGDPLGVELGVSLKNVIAIAAGIIEGLKLGHNAMGALLTRGLAEISRLGVAMGARRETFLGLGGLGDLVTTCTSNLSRNHQVGLRLAEGRQLSQILEEMVMVAEGVRTTRSTMELSERLDVEMPITAQVYAVLFDEKDPREALTELMQRPPRHEFRGVVR